MPDKLCFKRQDRLLDRPAFSTVFEARKKRFSGTFIIYSHENQCDYPRIGIILSKKQVRLASKRNQLRRLIRESFRLNLTTLPRMDFVLVGLNAMQHLNRKEIVQCIEKQWEYYRQSYARA